MEENKLSDEKRNKYLEDLGIKVLRYSNVSINESFNDICDDILLHLGIEV